MGLKTRIISLFWLHTLANTLNFFLALIIMYIGSIVVESTSATIFSKKKRNFVWLLSDRKATISSGTWMSVKDTELINAESIARRPKLTD